MVTPEEIQSIQLFATLGREACERIARAAADITLMPGEYVAREGDERALCALLDGHVEVLKVVDGIETHIGERFPGNLIGEIPITLGTAFPVDFRATERSRVMRLEAHDYHAISADHPQISASVGKLAQGRISGLQHVAAEPPAPRATVVGDKLRGACGELRRFLDRNQITYTWVAPEDADAETRWGGPLPPREDHPTLRVAASGKIVSAPPLRRVAELIELQTQADHAAYDTVIVGGGPAGLAAAVYGASEGLRTIVVEREAPGGQAGTSSRIENYLGFPSGVSGDELAGRALQQAKRLGAEILVTRTLERIDPATRRIYLDGGDVLQARTIILACGVSWRRLEIDGFDRLAGKGISYGAARSDARGTHGLDVHIVGAGNSAGQAALHFANHARQVTILCRSSSLAKSMSHYLIAQLDTRSNIRVLTGSEVGCVRTARRRWRRSTFSAQGSPSPTARSAAASTSSSARTPRPAGSRPRSPSTSAATCSPAPTCGTQVTGRSTVTRCCSRRASPASSPAATCARGPSSESLRQSARAAWRSPSCTSTSARRTRRRRPPGRAPL